MKHPPVHPPVGSPARTLDVARSSGHAGTAGSASAVAPRPLDPAVASRTLAPSGPHHAWSPAAAEPIRQQASEYYLG
jgi:hypothetical protein